MMVLSKRFFKFLLLITFISVPFGQESTATDFFLLDVSYRANGKDKNREIACQASSPGILKDRNGTLSFLPLKRRVRRLRKKKKADESNIRLKKRLRDLNKLYKAGKVSCESTKDADEDPQLTPPTPSSPAPTPEPTASQETSFFDRDGNVTIYGKTTFGIPSNLEANLVTGMSLWQSYCQGCHEERRRNTFDDLRAVISEEPMYYDSLNLPDEELAHIMAYISRFRFPQ